jgi:hypothetical protein
MDGAPEVNDHQFSVTGHFDQESQKVDAYWKTNLATGNAAAGKSGG